MNWYDKVVWQEGMFLRAQHFQQQSRHVEHLLQSRAAPLRPWPWGLVEISLDRDLLAAGKLALHSAAGIFEDGTPFAVPMTADAPAPLDVPDTARNATVYLAIPVRQAGSAEISFLEGPEAAVTRHKLASFEASDTHSDNPLGAEIQVARPRLRLMLDSDERAGFTCIPIARVAEVQADRRVMVDERFVATCLRIAAAPPLTKFVAELLGMAKQRADSYAGRLAQPGNRGVPDVAQFLLLQALNRWQPLLAHWADAGSAHPETFYAALAQMAGELATFSDPGRRCATYPGYRHDDLTRSFAPVIADLRRALSASIDENAVAIPLRDARHGVRVGAIGEHRNLLRTAAFVLSVAADMPTEDLRRLFPSLVTIGAVEQIRELVNVRLPGIAIRPLPVAPRQIPFHAGAVYFELDRNSPHWQQMQSSGGFAIYTSGEFPNLRLELWAILG
jgi:type VI secretion system protein ImpJ